MRAALDASAQRELLARLSTLDLVGVPAQPVRPEVRAAVEQAFFEQRTLRIRYLGRDHVLAWRRVRVRRVVMDRRETLLNCDDLDKGEPRQFRLHQVAEAAVEGGQGDPSAHRPPETSSSKV
ncbi:MAG: WYL domain-containing protein [Sandaracinaceae bacterium]